MKVLLVLALITPLSLWAQRDETAIRAVLDKQVADWNRGDIPTFVQSYAENCTFVGKRIVHGRAEVQARYRRDYATPEAMGHLTFSDLKINKLDKQVAVVTGAFHLDRPPSAGGDASGIFSLVFVRQGRVWRIVLDHTS